MQEILLKKEYIYSGDLILVNYEHELKKQISTYNLVQFDENYNDILIDYNLNLALQKVLKKINANDKIIPVSGYRTYNEQKKIYDDSIIQNGEEFTKQYVAFPNTGEHQTGLAIDLGLKKKKIDFIRPSFPYTGICQQFRETMSYFGFIQRYTEPKENITKIASEMWHMRYVGYPHSEIMLENNLCLEEYIDYLRNYEYGKSSLKFKNYEIMYLKMDKEEYKIHIDNNFMVKISGNNVDGIIITTKRMI